MIEMLVSDIAKATGADVLAAGDGRTCRGCAIDTRRVGDDGIFVAFAGERIDANSLAADVVSSGAGCVVLTREPDEGLVEAASDLGCAVLRAADDDGEEFMLRLAGAWRADNDWVVVGVTGSVGKTTTKDMLACALACSYTVHATAGNFNNLIGLPLTLMSASADDQVVVAEMGMNHAGELARLTECARPQVALVTNVGTSHIGLLGSREGIARAKAEIIDGPAHPVAAAVEVEPRMFLTAGDDFTPFIRDAATAAGVEVTLAGLGRDAQVRVTDVQLDEMAHPSFDLILEDGTSLPGTLALSGRAVLADLALAMAVSCHLGVDPARALEALSTLEPTHMRQEVVTCPGGYMVIDDSYNASPNSMAASLDALCEFPTPTRRIAVLGAMGELGDASRDLHRLTGAYAAAKPLDMLVIVGGGDALEMLDAARTMGLSEDKIVAVDDVESAVSLIGPILTTGDLVLVKASRSVGLDAFVKGIKE